ncbi:hypothetical protein KL930_003254 [Ogataea haglerorum]|uniref:USP domain-containing protein n=1 Tax=Ogataea haglerorum TaxID=1937702 RepID=A0AAN6D3H2_9ASCO|nr:uncharacterized protein KL911_002494 [Ogataea haglerorum]KAG7706957.1 hypothetical protein KL914_002841 [Ogataea haglerorum]KAG7725785.1 hypothetical protein KL933_003833 [Ogataea haglerorum]KAG7731820.1 hypothetical protein KL948_002753 [Ogataea haglerorum]KAG7739014.1 hypothetical protein KL923_002814 [Ogataea haglerorum]KAG7748069.1 hypothetical protein KL912_002746 [Ogataea haglerorum]
MFSKRPDKLTTGLINMTTDCFANVCVQALASLPGLNEYLNAMTEFRNSLIEQNSKLPSFELHQALIHLLSKLQETVYRPRVLSVWDFLHVIEKIYNSKISVSQHDAHELLQLILETLEKEHVQLRKTAPNVPEFPFKGEVSSQLRCMRCGKKSSTNYNPMMILSLPVPQESSIDLESMLRGSESDIIDDYSCTRCKINYILSTAKQSSPTLNKLKRKLNDELLINDDLEPELDEFVQSYEGVKSPSVKSTVHKETSIILPPKLLAVHLSRSIYDTQARRNQCNVEFKEFLKLNVDTAEMERFKSMDQDQDDSTDEEPSQLTRAISSILEEKPGSEFLEESEVHSDAEDEKQDDQDDDDDEELEDDEDDDDLATKMEGHNISPAPDGGIKTITYKLNAVVRHQGSHSLGHYECYRRKPVFYKNAVTGEYYHKFPKLEGVEDNAKENEEEGTTDIKRQSSMSKLRSRVSSLVGATRPRSPSVFENAQPVVAHDKKLASSVKTPFWRISDSKITECSVSEVMDDSRAVYMLFYERID